MWTKFNSACYLINDEIMVDFPNGACKYLYRLGINPINVNIYFVIVFCYHIGKRKADVVVRCSAHNYAKKISHSF